MPGSASTTRSPLDLAIAAAVQGDLEEALRHACAILVQDPSRAIAVLVVGKCLGTLVREQAAISALKKAVKLAVLEGSLPRAMAAVIELSKLGTDTSAIRTELARVFAHGSKRLLAKGATPPALVRQRLSGIPLPRDLKGNALIDYAAKLVSTQDGLEEADDDRPVPRQMLFSSLDEDGLAQTLGVLDLVWVDAGTALVEQATSGQAAYVVARGEVEVVRSKEGEEQLALARLGSGAVFGEMALLSRATRAASVVASRPSLILAVRKSDLDAVVEAKPEVGAVLADYCRRRMMDNLVRTSRILGALKASDRPTLMQQFVTRTFEQGDRIIRQGTEAEGLHLIASGEVAVVRKDGSERTILAKLNVGEVVGEVSLVLRRPAIASVIATAPTVTLHLPREHFMGIVRRYPEILSHLYELAVERDTMTTSIVAQEATEAADYVLV